ncbi:MAG: FAD-dependent oxidoreductase [Pseudanabaena sp. CRU_2_10]|nr:FAD-dependent oxidoreductase [Pseudanabaena sp. CRU_2_10]
MKIAIIGGGASGMVTAYLLDKQGHHVTVFEKQPVLGGHIRTLNQNVKPNRSDCDLCLESGVLEFPIVFHNFLALMKELEVELEPVNIGSALFLQDGRHFLSAAMIQKNFTGIQRAIEYLRLDGLYARSAGLWIATHFARMQDLYDRPMSQFVNRQCIRNCWLKLLTMYSYSMPFELIDNFPAALVIPTLREYIFVNWVRIKGGVYSYIAKILERFKGDLLLDVDVVETSRSTDAVRVRLSDGVTHAFDNVCSRRHRSGNAVISRYLTDAEIKRFSAWKSNYAKTAIHTDTSMYGKYGIKQFSEFDFFQTESDWGYNAYLNQLCGISSSEQYSLAFNLDDLIAKDKIVHVQEHHTPLYTVESFRYRDEVIGTNGENHTYHAGAYLGDGLHEGAIASAMRVAQLIG